MSYNFLHSKPFSGKCYEIKFELHENRCCNRLIQTNMKSTQKFVPHIMQYVKHNCGVTYIIDPIHAKNT